MALYKSNMKQFVRRITDRLVQTDYYGIWKSCNKADTGFSDIYGLAVRRRIRGFTDVFN